MVYQQCWQQLLLRCAARRLRCAGVASHREQAALEAELAPVWNDGQQTQLENCKRKGFVKRNEEQSRKCMSQKKKKKKVDACEAQACLTGESM